MNIDWKLKQLSWGESVCQETPMDLQLKIFQDCFLVGAFDIQRDKTDQNYSVASLVVFSIDVHLKELVWYDTYVNHDTPTYLPGFLGFSECPSYEVLWNRCGCKPDIVLIDGNGILHPRHSGSASQFGLTMGIPSIGVAKSLIGGIPGILPEKSLRSEAAHTMPGVGDFVELTENTTQKTLGVALRTSKDTKPIYVSVGHKISLEDAIKVVRMCCWSGVRQPDPIRAADQLCRGKTEISSIKKSLGIY
jgi:deoxyinosine 3'endonuclease (endonuclease V)